MSCVFFVLFTADDTTTKIRPCGLVICFIFSVKCEKSMVNSLPDLTCLLLAALSKFVVVVRCPRLIWSVN